MHEAADAWPVGASIKHDRYPSLLRSSCECNLGVHEVPIDQECGRVVENVVPWWLCWSADIVGRDNGPLTIGRHGDRRDGGARCLPDRQE